MIRPTKDTITVAVRESLAEILERRPAEIPPGADLRSDLDVDSLQQLELVGMLEERFEVFLDADDLGRVASIEELAERAAQKLGPSE